MARKFVKAIGLHNIFEVSGSTLDLTRIKTSVQNKVNETSIVFLTASGDSSYGYSDDTKYIWTMNTLYPTNSYDEIIENNEEVIANAFVKVNDAIGLNSSFGLIWSQESGIEQGTNIKNAIEENSSSIKDIIEQIDNIKDIDVVTSNILVNHEDRISEQKNDLNDIDNVVSDVLINHENDIENLDEVTSNILVNHEDRLQTISNDDIILANIIVNYEYRIKELENKIKNLENNI